MVTSQPDVMRSSLTALQSRVLKTFMADNYRNASIFFGAIDVKNTDSQNIFLGDSLFIRVISHQCFVNIDITCVTKIDVVTAKVLLGNVNRRLVYFNSYQLSDGWCFERVNAYSNYLDAVSDQELFFVNSSIYPH